MICIRIDTIPDKLRLSETEISSLTPEFARIWCAAGSGHSGQFYILTVLVVYVFDNFIATFSCHLTAMGNDFSFPFIG